MTSIEERFEFRNIRPEEADQAAQIEQIGLPPNEACSEKMRKERVRTCDCDRVPVSGKRTEAGEKDHHFDLPGRKGKDVRKNGLPEPGDFRFVLGRRAVV